MSKKHKRLSIEFLKHTALMSAIAYTDSKREIRSVLQYYHGKHYSFEQLAQLAEWKQPAEKFNIIKKFSKLLTGYLVNLVSSTKILTDDFNNRFQVEVLKDLLKESYRQNKYKSLTSEIYLQALHTGLFLAYVEVENDDEHTDEFGRPYRKINIKKVPENEILLDPNSKELDYSDSIFLHRFKWVSETNLLQIFKDRGIELKASVLEKEDAFRDIIGYDFSMFRNFNNNYLNTAYELEDHYQLIQSIVKDEKGESWVIYWIGDTIIHKEKYSNDKIKSPYIVFKTETDSENAEYYGVFKDLLDTQDAVNQAILHINHAVNSTKVMFDNTGVVDVDKFKKEFSKISAFIEVKELKGVKELDTQKDIKDQYTIIEQSIGRIQSSLGVNDSFLGITNASDSGVKVETQKGATITSLSSLVLRISDFQESITWCSLRLMQEYFKAHQMFNIMTETHKDKWIEINRPYYQTKTDSNGYLVEEPIIEPILDKNGNYEKDEKGNILVQPVDDPAYSIKIQKLKIYLEVSTDIDEQDIINQQIRELLMSPALQSMSTISPADYYEFTGSSWEKLGSPKLSHLVEIFHRVANQLRQESEQQGGLPPALPPEMQKLQQLLQMKQNSYNNNSLKTRDR